MSASLQRREVVPGGNFLLIVIESCVYLGI
jgi:hypothetical protein